MIYLITGGSGSGKSEYAEQLAKVLYDTSEEKGVLYYLATMQAKDEESLARIERHRRLRKGKGFVTKECTTQIGNLKFKKNDVLLLECMSNLLANEMFLEEGQILKKIKKQGLKFDECFVSVILDPILEIANQTKALVVVTNEIFSDGNSYEKETELYIQLLGKINQELAKKAEGVVEVVCSIPVCRKGKMPC